MQDIRPLAICNGHPKVVPHGMYSYQQLEKLLKIHLSNILAEYMQTRDTIRIQRDYRHFFSGFAAILSALKELQSCCSKS